MEHLSFENIVSNLVTREHFEKNSYLLSSIEDSGRMRFILAVQMGLNIPTAYDQVKIAEKLPAKNYQRYITYISSKVNSHKLSLS